MENNTASIARAAQLIRQSDFLIICAGAGMGVDSGLPDFRGSEGFWRAYPALGKAGMHFESIASPSNFETDPALAWGFYGHRLQLYRDTVPHKGFDLLKCWADARAGGCQVFTSNVDGQFQKAGFDPEQVEECHGSIHYVQCSDNCSQAIWNADDILPEIDAQRCLWLGPLPTCQHCGAVLRPNILMFGDWCWIDERSQLQADRRRTRLTHCKKNGLRPVIIEIGAGTAIPSVRHFAANARRAFDGLGARLIRINPREWKVSGPEDVGLPMGALVALSAIDDALQKA